VSLEGLPPGEETVIGSQFGRVLIAASYAPELNSYLGAVRDFLTWGSENLGRRMVVADR